MSQEKAKDRVSYRIDAIDLLRGLSIFFVMMNHVNMRLFLSNVSYGAGLPQQLVSSLIWNGQRGVQIFFCVSGFLIASNSIKRWGALSMVRPGEFYWLRISRIAPLFLALLVVLSVFHLFRIPDFILSQEAGGLAKALFSALTFRINVHEANLGYLPANWDILWSLSVEEMFYLFFPLLCLLLARKKGMSLVLLILILLGPFARTIFAGNNEVWSEYSYLGSTDAIAFGILTAMISADYQFSKRTLRTLGAIGVLLLTFALAFTQMIKHLGLNRVGLSMSILSLATCLVILAADQSRWKAPKIFRPIMMLGERSYEIYLTHMFVVFIFFHIYLKIQNFGGAVLIFFISSILASAVLGEMIANFYSEPLNLSLRKSHIGIKLFSRRRGEIVQ